MPLLILSLVAAFFSCSQATLSIEERMKLLEEGFKHLLKENEMLESRIKQIEEELETISSEESNRSKRMYLLSVQLPVI